MNYQGSFERNDKASLLAVDLGEENEEQTLNIVY